MSTDEDLADYIDRRSDPAKTAQRHDEVIHLRELLIKIREDLRRLQSKDVRLELIRATITKEMQRWGEPDDCV